MKVMITREASCYFITWSSKILGMPYFLSGWSRKYEPGDPLAAFCFNISVVSGFHYFFWPGAKYYLALPGMYSSLSPVFFRVRICYSTYSIIILSRTPFMFLFVIACAGVIVCGYLYEPRAGEGGNMVSKSTE